MKASIEQTELLKSMARVQSIVERRTTIPILSNVLLEAKESFLYLRTTDLDIEVLDKVSADVETPGSLTVGANTLYEIVRKLPDGSQVEFLNESGSNQLEIVASRSKFFLSTLPKEDFPIMATEEYDFEFSLKSKVIKRLFDKSKFAMSSEETRYYLNGVYLHPCIENEKHINLKIRLLNGEILKINLNEERISIINLIKSVFKRLFNGKFFVSINNEFL